ncbi:E3 ubiquitin-protein ligase TRAIP [Drosophila sulfurigaster albostrigata]|uniref:E3 ubiquitin-protein ligase TRAIP n=1 Tax=Drosophila sulfurigaster albostrigata TaxID=89887 RepID=UPI002D21BE3D|nr:E3 ubiquitin-protein ligase TRAIP [Drosophila sulfurigaster albostrigata]
MLNLNCVICAELFTQSDEVYVTTCGHMFHHTCLMQWLERSKTCPQCRNKCTNRNIIRVYFNLANLDVSRIDVGSLQEQLDNANLAMKMKEQESNKIERQMKELKETQKKCLKTIAGLEKNLQKKDFVVSSYVEQINVLKSDARVVDELRKENKSLKQQINTMEGVSAILTAGAADADRLLKNEANPNVLANWVSTLKRELRQCETKKTELRNVLKVVQNDLRKELEAKRRLEEQMSHLESDLYRAQEKLKTLQGQPIDVDASSNNSLGLNTNLVALKLEERRNTISPTIKQSIKRIEESTSPYLNIKSSSVGMAHLLKPPIQGISKISPIKTGSGISMTSGVIRKTTSDLSEKYSIFKKPRLLLGASSSGGAAAMGSNFAYDGMGGSGKIDPFAQRAAEEAATGVTSQPSTNTVNFRLKAGTLRNIKLKK